MNDYSMIRRKNFLAVGFTLTLLAACAPIDQPVATSTAQPNPTIIPLTETSLTPILLEQAAIHTTQNDLTGNHLIGGTTDLANAAKLNIPIDGKPLWLVSGVLEDDVVFVAVMDDGVVQAFKLSGDSYEPFDISPIQLPTGMPPTLIVTDNNLRLIMPPDDASLLTNPISINGRLVYIASNGELVMNDADSQTRLPINALLDSRILVDESDRLLVLIEPTTRYDHGIAGDEFEASAIMLIQTEPELRITQIIPIAAPDVIEGISAIWADIDNDGTRDIIVTLSNNQTGARIVAYREDGTLLAESKPIGLGHRWRHQIAVAQFEPNKPPLLVDVRTPHIGGIVEFFQLNEGKLDVVMEIRGYSTHSIGSRNLDTALAGDFNNDGIIELLAPDQGHGNLSIISLDGMIATLPLDGVLTSNLSAAELDGKLYVGAGTQGNLKVWIPDPLK
jgi:hypothetical protein